MLLSADRHALTTAVRGAHGRPWRVELQRRVNVGGLDGLLLGVGTATEAAGSATDAAGSATDATGERLRADLRKVEGDLQQQGWRVALDLKPLHGEQGAAVPTIEEARAAVAAFEASG